ncbi:hypothetical protein NZNM25_12330 [Nitrosopumilus zosterae]|uniref:Uncharacterized protein n=2 Tax=Nitrosopumilus zosterae TaxID=718286 RepID=A0A2S2KRZ7_9ARCH|nr:hypothetical protein NZNM25_12330 [Nitrosopumilus zosterae]
MAMFIITAVYVGYHAMQQPVEEIKDHNVEFELLNVNSGIEQIDQNTIIIKTHI